MKTLTLFYHIVLVCSAIALSACGGESSTPPASDSNLQTDEEASFIATATTEIITDSELETRLKQTFSSGLSSEVTYTLLPGQTYTPTPSDSLTANAFDPLISYSNVTSDAFAAIDSYEYALSYFIPYSALPAEASGLLGIPAAFRAEPIAATASDMSGIKVAVKGVVKSAGKKTAESIAKSGFGTIGGHAVKVGGGVLDGLSALEAKNQHEDWSKQLDKIEECVKNPLHPIDKQSYQQDPSLKQKHLDKINAIRSELNQNSGARFVNKLAGTASGLLPGPVKAIVWPFIAGGKAYTDDAMKQINNALVEALTNEMPKCENFYTGWLHPRSTIGDEFDEELNLVTLDNIVWSLVENLSGEVATYNMNSIGSVEIIKRGSDWLETCDAVDQVLNGVLFRGVLAVYDGQRTDAYNSRYAWAVAPNSPLVSVTAKCDHDNNPDTARIAVPVPVALSSHFASCGYESETNPDPFGQPQDMPQYSSVALLEGNGSWACEFITHRAEWMFEENIQ